jgi:hypothetical protein
MGFSTEKNYTLDEYDRRFYDEHGNLVSSVDLMNNLVSKGQSVSINFGMDYAASQKTTYGFLINWNKGTRTGILIIPAINLMPAINRNYWDPEPPIAKTKDQTLAPI